MTGVYLGLFFKSQAVYFFKSQAVYFFKSQAVYFFNLKQFIFLISSGLFFKTQAYIIQARTSSPLSLITPLSFGEGLGVRLYLFWRGVGGEALSLLERGWG